jgi:uncharacterized protein YndB with AHSA1/START domain
MEYRIEKQIELKAPVSRVWRAVTDYREFGEWFRVKLEGPFIPGEISRGHISYPGYEHLKWEAVVQKLEPENYFSFTWHPYAIDPKVDYSKELLQGNSNPRGIPAQENGDRHIASTDRIRLRKYSR